MIKLKLSVLNIIALKWVAIITMNMTGNYKLLPFMIILACIFMQKDHLSIRGCLAGLCIVLILTIKLLQNPTLSGGSTVFEGVSFIYLVVVFPFIRRDLHIIGCNQVNFIYTVLRLLLLILLIDLCLRLWVHGPAQFINIVSYSKAKFGGLFTTSNTAGSIAFLCFVLSLKLKKYSLVSLTVLILVFTLSRVAIVAVLITLVLHLWQVSRYQAKFIFVILCGFIVYSLGDSVLSYVINDGSFKSKIDLLLSGVVKFGAETNFLVLLLGYEADPMKVAALLDVRGWSPHLSSLKALMYFGLVGFLTWITAHIYIFYVSKLRLLVLGGLIIGLAGLPILWQGILFALMIRKDDFIHE